MTALAAAAGTGVPLAAAAETTAGTAVEGPGGKFDFDTPYSRIGTDSTKWDQQIRTYGKDKIDSEGVGRWRTLSEYTISMMGSICNPMLEASGYPPVEVKAERSVEEARRRYELGLKMRRPSSKGDG